MDIVPLIDKQAVSAEISTARLNLWEGSVRSSKTICSLLRWLEYVREGPAGNLAMVGRTERTLKRNIIDPLIEMLGPKRAKFIAGAGEFWLLGRRIYVAGANNEAAVTKIQGLTLAGVYVDEVTTIPEGFWSMLLTRLSVEGASLFGTCNPDNPNHWLMRDYLKRASTWLRHDGTIIRPTGDNLLDLVRMSFRLADNPTLSAAYVAALNAEFTGLWRLRYIEGLWVLAEGAIYDTFDPTPGAGHVIASADMPTIDEWVIGIDYGTTNPFVALLMGRGPDDRLYTAAEWRWDSRAQHGQKTDAEYSTALRAWLVELNHNRPVGMPVIRPEQVIVDPSATSFTVQLWRDGWAGVHGANNAVEDGIRWTSTLLARDRIRIVNDATGPWNCEGFIGEKVGYVWDEKAALKGVEQPLKQDDHGPDAERYGVMGTETWWRHWLTQGLPAAA